MKLPLSILLAAILVPIACGQKEQEQLGTFSEMETSTEEIAPVSTEQLNSSIDLEILYRFINPAIDSLEPGKLYRDTVTLEWTDDNLDYWYIFVSDMKGDTIRFVYRADSFGNVTPHNLAGRIIDLTWQVDTLHEAGLGEAPYLDRIVFSAYPL